MHLSRRRALAGIGAFPLYPWLRPRQSPATQESTQDGTVSSHVLSPISEGPFEPHIPTQSLADSHIITENGLALFDQNAEGWEQGSDEELTRLIEMLPAETSLLTPGIGIDPYVISARNRLTGLLAMREDLPAGAISYYETDQEHSWWYTEQYENGRWADLDDAFTNDPHRLSQQRYNGDYHWYPGQEGESGLFSVFATPSMDYLVSDAVSNFKMGFSSNFMDHTAIPRFHGLDFSHWAQRAFRDYLQSLSSERRSELGIEQPSEFDMRAYIEQNNITPTDDTNPFEDLVFREYTLFHHRGIKDFWTQCNDRIHAQFPDSEPGRVNLYGNHFIGSHLGNTPVASFYTADAFDIVSLEQEQMTVPPDSIRDIDFKIGQSMARYDRPLLVWGRMNTFLHPPESLFVSDLEQYRPNLLRIQYGEAVAHGAKLPLSLTGGNISPPENVVNNIVSQDLTVDDSLQSLADFVWVYEPYLTDTDPDHNVAVVYSLSTLVWDSEPDWFDHRTTHYEAVVDAADALQENQIPYDIITFGHPDLWTDPEQLARLSTYDVVALPDIECVSDEQLAALRSAVDAETTFVVTGQVPDRAANFGPRDDIRSFVEGESAVRVVDSYEREGTHPVVRTVDQISSRQVSVDSPNIGITVLTQPDAGRTLVHFVNYDYEQSADRVPPKTNVEAIIRGDFSDSSIVRWYDDSGMESVRHDTTSEGVSLTIPELTEWGFLLFADGPESLVETENSEANERISAVSEAISAAREEGRTESISDAEASLHRAQVAADYGREELAAEVAAEAMEAVEQIYETPTVGIDQAQTTAPEDLIEFRQKYDQYEYELIQEWTAEALDAVDVFIIPSGTQNQFVQFDTDSADIETLGSFVESGGSLLLLGRAGMDSGLNDIAGRFGLEFDDRIVQKQGSGDQNAFQIRAAMSTVTPFVPSWRGRFGVPLRETGEAEVLAEVAEYRAQTYLGDDTSQSAEGQPMMAGLQHGSGTVVAIGESEQFSAPATLAEVQGRGLVEGLIPQLARLAQGRHLNQPDGDSDPAEPISRTTTSSEQSEQSGASGDGFTVATGVLAGALAMIVQWLVPDDEDE